MERVVELQALASQTTDPQRLEMLQLHRQVMQRNQEIQDAESAAQLQQQAASPQDHADVFGATQPSELFPEMAKPMISRPPPPPQADTISDLRAWLRTLNMIILGGVMLLAGGTVVLVVIAGRQFLKLKYRLRHWSWDHFQSKFRRQKLPVYVDGRRYSIGTVEYFEPVEMSLFNILDPNGTIEGVPVPQLRSEFFHM